MTRKGGIVVPASVIQRGLTDGSFAYVIKDDLKAEMRPVKVAQIEGTEALIDEGLSAGERVVVDGQYKLQPGATVKLGDAPGHTGGAQPGGHAGPKPGGSPRARAAAATRRQTSVPWPVIRLRPGRVRP